MLHILPGKSNNFDYHLADCVPSTYTWPPSIDLHITVAVGGGQAY